MDNSLFSETPQRSGVLSEISIDPPFWVHSNEPHPAKVFPLDVVGPIFLASSCSYRFETAFCLHYLFISLRDVVPVGG